MVTGNSQQLIEYLRSKYKIEVFFSSEVDQDDIEIIEEKILAIPGVLSTTVIEKADAVRIFEDQFGEDIISMLGYNPLPVSCVVNVDRSGDRPLNIRAIIKDLKVINGVSEISYQGHLIQRIETYYQKLMQGMAILTGVFVLITVLIISNTIRLSVYARRELIHTMQLIGATRLFIKVPFIIEGMFQALISAGLAYGVIYGMIELGNRYLPRSIAMRLDHDPRLAIILISLAVIMGLFGSHRASAKFLRR